MDVPLLQRVQDQQARQPGPFRAQRVLTDAQLFVVPIGDPMMLLVKGFETLSEARSE